VSPWCSAHPTRFVLRFSLFIDLVPAIDVVERNNIFHPHAAMPKPTIQQVQ